MMGTIPAIRVNYTILQLVKSLFISERSDKYRKRLVDILTTYFSNENIFLVSSARSAIYQIVRSLPQHKVIVPAYTCEVVIEAVQLAGKEIIYADIDKETLNINAYPEIDADTIVIATHQYGILSEIKMLAYECKDKGAVLIEDCAGSFGGRIGSQLAGTFGDYGVFSFSASKTIQSPTKGGFIVAKNKKALDAIKPLPELWGDHIVFKLKQVAKGIGFCVANNRLLGSLAYKFGRDNKHLHNNDSNLDFSYHRELYEWQAYVVINQFADIDAKLMERRKLFMNYHNGIFNKMIQKPIIQYGGVCIRYAILVEDRDRFISECKSKKISVGKGYHRLYCPASCDVAHDVSKMIVYLPFGNGFSESEIKKVIETVNEYK